MVLDLTIRDLFDFGDLRILLADRPADQVRWRGRDVRIVAPDGRAAGEVRLIGERFTAPANRDLISLETRSPVALTPEDARSGRWAIRYPPDGQSDGQ